LGTYLDRKSGVPPIILQEIDRRLSELSGERAQEESRPERDPGASGEEF
jgi:hypothetical protein